MLADERPKISMLKFVRTLLIYNVILLLPAMAAACAQSQRKPSEVLVVYNADSPISTAVATDYASKRHVANVLAIRCADSALTTDAETIQFTDYKTEIASPVSQYLATHKGIDFIVLTKGVPIRISGAGTGEVEHGDALPSLDSYLAAIDYPTISGAGKSQPRGIRHHRYGLDQSILRSNRAV